jgi:DNA-binding transcriptional regulator/RsmH inhibitor MraZ
LEGEAVLVGVQDHMELWRPESWEAYAAQRRDRYDQLAEAAFGPAVSTGEGTTPQAS